MKITVRELIELEQAIRANYQTEVYLPPKSVGGEPVENEPEQLRDRIEELEEQLREVHAHFKKTEEEWDKFRRMARPAEDLEKHFQGKQVPPPPSLEEMYPVTKKVFESWRELFKRKDEEISELKVRVEDLEKERERLRLDLRALQMIEGIPDGVRWICDRRKHEALEAVAEEAKTIIAAGNWSTTQDYRNLRNAVRALEAVQ